MYAQFLARSSVAISKINGHIDFLEDKVDKAMNWVKGVSPKIGDHLEEHYQRVIMERSAGPKIHLKAFRDQLSHKIPTSEAAVERVSSRHTLVYSPLRSCLKSDIVDKTLFVRYNIAFLYQGLPFLHFECKNDESEFGVFFE